MSKEGRTPAERAYARSDEQRSATCSIRPRWLRTAWVLIWGILFHPATTTVVTKDPETGRVEGTEAETDHHA